MVTYETDEIMFEVPSGYVDKSMNIFVTPPSAGRAAPMSIVITRDPRTEEPVAQQASKLLREVPQVPGFKVLGQRDRSVGPLPAREARVHGHCGWTAMYQSWNPW